MELLKHCMVILLNGGINMTRIEFINYPFVFTNDGKRLTIQEIEGEPKVGDQLELTDRWRVKGKSEKACEI